jgi:hypothetical protein
VHIPTPQTVAATGIDFGVLATEASVAPTFRQVGFAGKQIQGIAASLAFSDHLFTFRDLSWSPALEGG